MTLRRRLVSVVAVPCALAAVTGCLDLQSPARSEERRAATEPAVAAAGERSVPCSDRQETVVDQPTGAGDVRVGELTVFNLDSLADQYLASSTTTSARGWSTLPFVVGAPAGRTVVLTVPVRNRGFVGLIFGARAVGAQFTRVRSALATVELHACAAHQTRFSDGVAETVGPRRISEASSWSPALAAFGSTSPWTLSLRQRCASRWAEPSARRSSGRASSWVTCPL